MKNQALFSLKDKSKKLKCRLLQFLFGALRVKIMVTLLETDQIRTKAKFPLFYLENNFLTVLLIRVLFDSA